MNGNTVAVAAIAVVGIYLIVRANAMSTQGATIVKNAPATTLQGVAAIIGAAGDAAAKVVNAVTAGDDE